MSVSHSRPMVSRRRQRGSMLIVAMMVLTLLSIIGISFVNLMRLESRATENYKYGRIATMGASSGESAAIAMLRGGMLWDGYVENRAQTSPWLYGIKNPREKSYGNQFPLATAGERSSLSGEFASGANERQSFVTKVIDTAAQIDLNGRQDALADMLDNLGKALEADPDIKKNPFKVGGTTITGADVMRHRIKLGGRFESKTQLKPLIGHANFKILEDYVTAHAWTDPKTYAGTDGIPKYNDLLKQTQINNQTGAALSTQITGRVSITNEPRAPININTAPRPVLIAVLTGIGGRRPFPYADISSQRLEQSNAGLFEVGSGQLPNVQEELLLEQTPLWIYMKPLDIHQATRIADEIIAERKRRPFTTWRAGSQQVNGQGFEDFVNRLDESLFPAPSTAIVVHPTRPTDTHYRGKVFNQSTPAGKMWNKGHPAIEATLRRQEGLPYSQANAWYFELVRGAIIANFNPNTRINKYNPDQVAYAAVDKSNLVKIEEGDTRTPRPGHTTEFCFGSNGIFEITTLSRMDSVTRNLTTGEVEDKPELISEAGKRSIVKIWETVRHTTQEDFERPFQAQGVSSFKDRQYVTTYPDPMDMLQRDYFFGDVTDGRVELSGYSDAARQAMDPSLRANVFRSRGNVLLAHGLRFRSPESTAKLGSLKRRGSGTNSQEYVREMEKPLNPEYSGGGINMDKRYSKTNWRGQDEVNEADNRVNDVRLDVAAKSDVFPDGLHSSIFRSSALTTRFLRFPAGRWRTNPEDPGDLGGRSQNEVGNLATYYGGVSFWIKLEFDPADPVFCGLIGATKVQTKVGQAMTDSEGSQFFVYKNTFGQLRVTRLYYHRAFTGEDQNNPLPYVPEDQGDSAEGEDEVEVDPKKTWARTDVHIDLVQQGWRAHEWHHVVVQYNDQAGVDKTVTVRLDGEEFPGIPYNIGDGMYCTLNQQDPSDGIYVGAFYRDQADAKEGLFKFTTNYDQDGKPSGESIKRVSANATIDEFMSFANEYVEPYSSSVGYFTDQQGKYSNAFEIAFPEGVDRVKLRSLTWTLYPPAMYRGQKVRWRRDNVEVHAINAGGVGTSVTLTDPGGDSRDRRFAGKWLNATQNLGRKTGSLVYEFLMRGAQGIDTDGSKIVASPVLDDVTLTYYLPTAQYLLSETTD